MANRLVINETIAAYASAAIDGANAAGGREAVVEVRSQMFQLVDILATNVELRLALDDESYTPEQRESIVRSVLGDFHPVVVEVVSAMAMRRNVNLFRRVCAEYDNLIESKLNFNVVDVTTVVELDDNLRSVITQKAASDLGRDVMLIEHVDPSIMGGIVMSTRGRYVDASVRRQLDNARIVLKQSDGGER